jgi:hypothetical protein
MLLLTLRGTPTLYYGDEIGMQQVAIAPDQVRDPFEKNVPGIGVGRDGCRTPMQWNAEAQGGFTDGEPWLPLAKDYVLENVANLSADAHSILSLYRALIKLRKATPELVAGSYAPVAAWGFVGLQAGICGQHALDRSQSWSRSNFDRTGDSGICRRNTVFHESGSYGRDRIVRLGSARRRRPHHTAGVIVRYSG